MSQPEPDFRDDELGHDALDWMHADSRRFAAQGPEFDVEQTLEAIRRRAGSFWESLDLKQQDEFRARARPRVFAAGARLMEEGEAADYLLVIIEGGATISARDRDGREQVIAERGPGELVGEHAVQRPGTRSATVVARSRLRVLDMKAEDFRDFLRTHPEVAMPPPRTM